jgi:hypothetical protein
MYVQLNVLTDQVAWALRVAGGRRGDRVDIYVNKSLA